MSKPPRPLAASLLLALAALGGAGCGVGGACPNDLPASCPVPAPSYAGEVSTIFAEHCTSCHAPGGRESNKPLDTYEHVYALRADVLAQVYACRMPPSGPALSTEERAALLGWLVCGAPNN